MVGCSLRTPIKSLRQLNLVLHRKAAVAVPSPVVTSVPAPTIMASGDVDTKLVERKINEANLPGPDYLELLQSAEQMKQYIPDETTRLKAAFGSIQGMDPRMSFWHRLTPIWV